MIYFVWTILAILVLGLITNLGRLVSDDPPRPTPKSTTAKSVFVAGALICWGLVVIFTGR